MRLRKCSSACNRFGIIRIIRIKQKNGKETAYAADHCGRGTDRRRQNEICHRDCESGRRRDRLLRFHAALQIYEYRQCKTDRRGATGSQALSSRSNRPKRAFLGREIPSACKTGDRRDFPKWESACHQRRHRALPQRAALRNGFQQRAAGHCASQELGRRSGTVWKRLPAQKTRSNRPQNSGAHPPKQHQKTDSRAGGRSKRKSNHGFSAVQAKM